MIIEAQSFFKKKQVHSVMIIEDQAFSKNK